MDFNEQLKKQISYLERSAQLYDSGYFDESIRIATTIRVLLHDSGKSISLLSHLNAKNIKLCSTIGHGTHENLVFMMGGLYIIGNTASGIEIAPDCYFNPNRNFTQVPVQDWIKQTVILTSSNATRENIYLGATNQDGGAHVDQKFWGEHGSIYEDISYQGGAGYIEQNINGQLQQVPLKNVQFAILRQMAHELLKSEELLALWR